jgi:hypothetical protein
MTFLSNRSHSRELHNLDNRPIVFLDSQLSNCDLLVQKVVVRARAIVINSHADGIKAITHLLKLSDCQEIHIITYGVPGCLYLGSSELSINTFIQYTEELKSWFNRDRLNSSFDSPQVSLYGCNVAAGDVGDEFISRLSQITTAEISASANILNRNILADV